MCLSQKLIIDDHFLKFALNSGMIMLESSKKKIVELTPDDPILKNGCKVERDSCKNAEVSVLECIETGSEFLLSSIWMCVFVGLLPR